jgi:uncharacterized protein YodC (DUF2158 family)
MNNRKFKVGDKVILVSDTDQIPMVVRQYVADHHQSIFLEKSMVDGFVICDWRDITSKPHEKKYHEDELKLVI